VSADDLAASLARLLRPATGSPHAWLALAIQGAEAVRQGRAAALSGIQVLSGLELRVVLDVPFDLPRALAAAPAAVLSPGGSGAGPFGPAGRAQGSLRLASFEGQCRGRPYADALIVSALDARRAARALLRAEADLLLRPEAAQGGASRELPALTASYALVNPRRLGPLAGPVRRTLADLDRGELTRLFVRGPAMPLRGPLPPAIAESPPEPPGRPDGPLRGAPARLTLLASSSPDLHRAVADRIQVKLFDRGLRVGVEVAEPAAFSARMAAGDWDLALVAVTFVSASPGLAAVQLAYALGGAPLAARALSRLGSEEPLAIAAEVVEAAGAVPLFASGLRATARAGLEGLSPRPDGLPDPGGLWSLAARPAR
jgi:MarR-like DNA-binding transcriptional regulator SgrR of sgrS sRNA